MAFDGIIFGQVYYFCTNFWPPTLAPFCLLVTSPLPLALVIRLPFRVLMSFMRHTLISLSSPFSRFVSPWLVIIIVSSLPLWVLLPVIFNFCFFSYPLAGKLQIAG